MVKGTTVAIVAGVVAVVGIIGYLLYQGEQDLSSALNNLTSAPGNALNTLTDIPKNIINTILPPPPASTGGLAVKGATAGADIGIAGAGHATATISGPSLIHANTNAAYQGAVAGALIGDA